MKWMKNTAAAPVFSVSATLLGYLPDNSSYYKTPETSSDL
jgi:hypothetical protein